MTQMSFASINYPTKEELRGKGIKSPSKLLSPKYLSQSSLAEQNRNPSSPKHVHFVNSIIILNKEDEAKEMLEDTTSVIDHEISSVVFGKPFVEATGLVYDMKDGRVMFEKDKEKIVFKMPDKMEMFKHIDFTDIKTDRIPPFVIESDDDNSKKTHYSDSLDLGPEYKYAKNVCRAIRSLIAMKVRGNKGEVT
ncbi:hypothetical protein Tco_0631094 [Tanacetum coccineum]